MIVGDGVIRVGDITRMRAGHQPLRLGPGGQSLPLSHRLDLGHVYHLLCLNLSYRPSTALLRLLFGIKG